MSDQPTLTDGVVWLTPFIRDDGKAIGDFNLDADHRRWFDQPPVDPDPVARRRHGEEVAERWRHAWCTGEELAFAVRLAADGETIGMAELRPEPNGRAGISYAIVPAHRRRRYGTRAVRLLADAGLDRLWFTEIELRCDADNVASARTAERAGFTFERIDPGAGVFEHVDGWQHTPRDERVYHRRSAREGLGSAPMTTVPALSPLRNRAREVTVVAFYVSVTLAAELATASPDDSKTLLVGTLWGTAVGLALAHWYAQTITAAIGRGAFHRSDAAEGLREVGAAVCVAFVLTVPFIVFETPTALVVSRWGVVIATSLIALALARGAGAGWTRACVEAVIVFAIGVAIIETKAALSH